MADQNTKNNNSGCITYFTTGGLVGLLGVIVAFIGLFMGAGNGGTSPTVAPQASPIYESPPTVVIQVPVSQDVTGVWGTEPDYGYFYRFIQNGTYITIEEVAPNGVVSGYGEGVISGTHINLEYVAANGSLGTAQFTVSSSWNQMTGAFINLSLGSQASVQLTRR